MRRSLLRRMTTVIDVDLSRCRVAGRRRSVGGLSLRCRLFRLAVPQYATVPDFLPVL